jgi:hypothetical protein
MKPGMVRKPGGDAAHGAFAALKFDSIVVPVARHLPARGNLEG